MPLPPPVMTTLRPEKSNRSFTAIAFTFTVWRNCHYSLQLIVARPGPAASSTQGGVIENPHDESGSRTASDRRRYARLVPARLGGLRRQRRDQSAFHIVALPRSPRRRHGDRRPRFLERCAGECKRVPVRLCGRGRDRGPARAGDGMVAAPVLSS